MQLLENVEDYYDENVIPRCSFKTNAYASPRPSLVIESLARMSFSYNKLPQEPLSLIVLKLDGSSFAIVVPKMGTVVHLKQGVEAAFSHLPKRGPGMVLWSHVWGHFCLSYDGQKLLTDANCIGDYGIRDGDKLHFVRHVSVVCNVVKEILDEEKYTFNETSISECYKNSVSSCMEHITSHHVTVIERQQSNNKEDKGVVRYCKYKLACFLRGWFSHQKRLTSLDVRMKAASRLYLKNKKYSKLQDSATTIY